MVVFPVRSPGFLMSHNAYRSILPRADAPLPERKSDDIGHSSYDDE